MKDESTEMDDSGGSPAQRELGIFLRAIWRRRRGIAAGTLAAALVAAIASLILPDKYEAIARLAIADFHLEQSMTGEEGRETYAARVSTRQTYAAMVYSQGISQQIVDKYDLEEELDLTAEKLLKKLAVAIVPNTSLLVLTLELPDPQLAYDVCYDFARAAEQRSRELNKADRERVEDVLSARLKAADDELNRIQAAITESGGSGTIRDLEAEIDLHIERRRLIEQQRIDLLLQRTESDGAGSAGVSAALDFIDDQRRQIDADLVAARDRWSQRAPVLQRLESEFETALATRSEIARRLESSEITVAGQIAELILVDPPVLPEDPTNPGLLAVTAAGFLLGLVLSTLIAGMAAGLEVTGDQP